MISWREYQAGDIAAVQCLEPDPFEEWASEIEQNGIGLATIEIDGQPLAVIGCAMVAESVCECFALVDRVRAAGHGRLISKMAGARLAQVGHALGVLMTATVDPADRVAQVFLRAVGFRRDGHGDDGLLRFTYPGGTANVQDKENHQEG